MKEIARKIVILVLTIVMSVLALIGDVSFGYSTVTVSVLNNLSVPVYKVVQFQVTLKDIPTSSNFALFDGDVSIPLEVVSKNSETLMFKTLVNFKPSEKKTLILKYGNDVSQYNSGVVFSPNFIGNTFVGIGSGSLYIVSLSDGSSVKVTDSFSKVIFSGTLNTNEAKSAYLKDNTIFKIEASKPILAEVSSLKSDYKSNSSDDISSVYGTYFKLFIPKEIFVSSIEATSLKITSDSGTVIFDGNLQDKGVFEDLSLNSGYYTVSSQKPVLIEFGYSDDNIYTVLYGSPSAIKCVSFGDIGVSSLYPGTSVTIKTESTFQTVTLKNAGDFYRIEVVKNFAPEVTEHAPVYITYSKPVLVYTDENFGNIGGEQMSSINGEGNSFIFRTGKVYNFEAAKRYRQVVVIAENDGTNVTLNGETFTLNALSSKAFTFYDSFSLIDISSTKPVSVFEVGLGTDKEFLSTLIPLHDNVLGTPVVSIGTQTNPNNSSPSVPSNGNQSNPNPEGSSGTSFFKNLLSKVGGFFVNLWGTISKENWLKTVEDTFNNLLASIKLTFNNLLASIKPTFNNLLASIKLTFNNLSARIIVLFYPLARILLPYVQKLLPETTAEQLSAIIFCALLLLLFILIIPKRKRQKKVIPTVPISEVKKKTLDFNVKTLEEKTEGKPSSIFEEQPLVITRKPKKENVSSTVEEGEGLATLKAKPKAPQTTETPPGKGEKGEIELKLPYLKKSQRKSAIEQVKKETPSFEPEVDLNEINIIKEVERGPIIPKEVEKPKEPQITEEKVPFEPEQKEEQGPNFADFGQPPQDAVLKAKEEDIVTNFESVEKKEEIPEKQEYSFVDKLKEKIAKENVSEPGKPLTPPEEAHEILKEEAADTAAKKAQEKRENEPVFEHKAEEVLPPETSTLDVLKNKLKEQSGKTFPLDIVPKKEEKVGSVGLPIQKEPVAPQGAKKVLERSFVADVESVSRILSSSFDEEYKKSLLRRVYISAQAKTLLGEKLIPNYIVGAIALTPIEQRIAEDMGKRIKGNVTTGEALLIAKKIRLSDIVVSDKPSIINYQGITINNIDEIL